ncbi:AAA family ATPase [Clostridium sp.]|uniref:AAA family ATPase n=1 Tax=Clostridium sp. TaxID=1506 RepID=UPI001B612120|nr:AAA family ATPase [Clostridium sp.]MBP3916600.1 AAA family ATPase [Clostridium sp.]
MERISEKNIERQDERLEKTEGIKYIEVECFLNFKEKCIELLSTYADNKDINLSAKLKKDRIDVLYDGEIIASNKGINFNKEVLIADIPLLISDNTAIIIMVDKSLIKEEIYDDEILSISRKIGYSEEKLEYLKENNVPRNLVMVLLSNVNTMSKVKKPEVMYLDEEKEKDKILAALIKILNKGHIRLFGPKGTGKNTLAETLSWILGREVIKFPGSPHSDKSELVGDVELITVKDSEGKEHVITHFQERALVEAMRTGKILIMDEVNANDPATLLILNGPCDDSRSILLQTGETVVAHKDFTVIATMNEDYMGTNKLNDAFVDRMLGIELKFPKNLNKVLLLRRPSVSKETLDYINLLYKKIVKLIDEGKSDESAFSIRGFIDFIDQITYGVSKKNAVEYCILNRIQNKVYRENVRQAIKIC